MRIPIARLLLFVGWVAIQSVAAGQTIRIATYNASLFRDAPGQLMRDLQRGDNPQAKRIAEVIQRVRPDVLLVNEFDYDRSARAARSFRDQYLGAGRNGCEAIQYPHFFTAPVNTGRRSGRDLDHNGTLGDLADAIGYGQHEGQYGMLMLSKFPIDCARVRTFQKFLWRDMPDAMLPSDPSTGRPFYDAGDLAILRLSSKSFWDVPIQFSTADTLDSFTLHLLCSHPTPPVFDGPEDRNGKRNHDEIRLVANYIEPSKSKYLVDDAGKRGGLATDTLFVIVGDLNCDPVDGQGVPGAIDQLLKHPRVDSSFIPTSAGGPIAVRRHADQHIGHRGDPAHVTSNFTGEGYGCLRIDYVLPSRGLTIVNGGVFWPPPGQPGSEAVTASDHRLVWIDVRLE